MIFDPQIFETASVCIVGLGNIGSQTALALGRLGIQNFELWDHDKVEGHNLSSQSFNLSDLGKFKVFSSKDQLQMLNEEVIVLSYNKKFEGKSFNSDILIIAVDSMKERKAIHDKMIRSKIPFPKLVIDGRMGGPQIEVYSVSSYKDWKETFVDNPSNDPCGARFICYSSMVIGSFIANQVKRFLKGEKLKSEILFNIDSYQLL